MSLLFSRWFLDSQWHLQSLYPQLLSLTQTTKELLWEINWSQSLGTAQALGLLVTSSWRSRLQTETISRRKSSCMRMQSNWRSHSTPAVRRTWNLRPRLRFLRTTCQSRKEQWRNSLPSSSPQIRQARSKECQRHSSTNLLSKWQLMVIWERTVQMGLLDLVTHSTWLVWCPHSAVQCSSRTKPSL